MEVVSKYFYSAITLLIIILIALPVVFILKSSLEIDFSNITYFLNYKLLDYTKNTLKLSLFTCFLSCIFGVIPAYIISMYKVKYSKIFDLLLIMPLSIPCYIMSFTYADFFGYQGTFFNFLKKKFEINFMFDVLTLEFLSFFFALSLFPYVYVTSRISFKLIGKKYFELSKILGFTKYENLIKVTIPLSLTGIYSGLLLIIMEVFNEYGAVHYFGIETFSNGIFKYWFSLDNKNIAFFLSFVLILIIILFLIINVWIKKIYKRINYMPKKQISDENLKKIRPSLYIFLIIPILFGFIFPLILVIKNSILYFGNYNLLEILILSKNTLFLALVSSLIIVLFSVTILNTRFLKKSNLFNTLKLFLTSGYAIPGAIIGLSIMTALSTNEMLTRLFIGSFTILIYSYVFRFISVAFFPLKSSFDRQPEIFEERAKSLNMSFIKRMIKIHLPLSKFAIIYAIILVFIDVVKELPLTLILRPFNFETLATQTYQYANEEMLGISSIYSLILILICVTLLFFSQGILNNNEVFRS